MGAVRTLVLLPLILLLLGNSLAEAGQTKNDRKKKNLHKAVVAVAATSALAAAASSNATRSKTASTSSDTPTPGAEQLLDRIFLALDKMRLEEALAETDTLLKHYPNFRLGHLIKGDLLLAKARPLSTFGNASNASAEQLADLRDEAIVRLKGYREKPAVDNVVPRYLLQMQPDQQHAIVVDTQRSRLYLYRNDSGRPRFVADYYITQGKYGSVKSKQGDKRTPVGVYHVTTSVPRNKLTDFYGSGAFPINYPNEWDKRLGRNGNGIWLHGTPSNTFSRPPRASDGCVVLANTDLNALAKNLQPGLTPVIISNQIEWLSLDDWQTERTALNRKIDEWRTDWESRDTARYLSHYSNRFNADGQNFEEFAKRKKQVNAGKEWIKVKIENLSVFRDPGSEDMVVVTFEQDYRSNSLSNQMKKRQYWVREGKEWKIIYEGAV